MDPISVEAAAAIIGITARRVRVLINEGRLPAVRIGARAFAIHRRDAEAFAKVQRPVGRPRRIAITDRHPVVEEWR